MQIKSMEGQLGNHAKSLEQAAVACAMMEVEATDGAGEVEGYHDWEVCDDSGRVVVQLDAAAIGLKNAALKEAQLAARPTDVTDVIEKRDKIRCDVCVTPLRRVTSRMLCCRRAVPCCQASRHVSIGSVLIVLSTYMRSRWPP